MGCTDKLTPKPVGRFFAPLHRYIIPPPLTLMNERLLVKPGTRKVSLRPSPNVLGLFPSNIGARALQRPALDRCYKSC